MDVLALILLACAVVLALVGRVSYAVIVLVLAVVCQFAHFGHVIR
jgi:hypothetical protein